MFAVEIKQRLSVNACDNNSSKKSCRGARIASLTQAATATAAKARDERHGIAGKSGQRNRSLQMLAVPLFGKLLSPFKKHR